MKLVNIANIKRDIFLFIRESNHLNIKRINDFFPFFYEPDNNGAFTGYDGTKLRKVYTSQPSDVPKMRSMSSYSSDIKFTNNYLLHKVNKIEETEIKYCFIDIEVLTDKISNIEKAKNCVSCITIYNSASQNIQTWFLPEQNGTSLVEKETNMLEAFATYMKREQFDIWFSWNVAFDYSYLFKRCKDFARKISPINSVRITEGDDREVFFPAGISIVDYLSLFKKVYMREASYRLDYIGEKFLGKGKEFKDVDFTKLTETIKLRNIGDVKMLVELESRCQLISYYDEIRRLCKCQWEDLYHNSRLVESLLLQEAVKRNIVLPNKQHFGDEEVSFQGAIRDTESSGVFFDISKCDLTSAYPSMIVNFCLDPANITENTDNTITVGATNFKQDNQTLFPLVVKRMLYLKDKLKKEKKANPDNKITAIKYDAIKAIVNSIFGVCGSPYFRLYNNTVAASITFLVRDLLTYVKERVEKEGLKVIYYDTDSVFINTKENITVKLNQFIRDWAKEKYNKNEIDLNFEYEGYFTKLCILGKCHYVGYLNTGKKEIKGVEMKRSSSSKYEAKFQEELIDRVLNKESREKVIDWINQEQDRIRTLDIEEIGFPCKIASRDYKNKPIFLTALENTQRIRKDFNIGVGELFYYIFMDNGCESLAFTSTKKDFVSKSKIDYNRVIDRNIYSKAEKIFEALNWYLPKNTNQMSLL